MNKLTLKKEEELQYRIKGPLMANDTRVLNILRSAFLQPPSVKEYNLNLDFSYILTISKKPDKFIHDIIVKLFSNEPPGFFVEAGALDGEFLSNTLWLEKEKKWKGLLVEPDQTNFGALLQKNRKAWSANSCISRDAYPKSSTFTAFSPTKSNDGKKPQAFAWFLRSQTYEHERGIRIANPIFSEQVFSTIQCFPLESFLLALNITEVDFLSLDMQGGEWDVLKYFPWDRINIRTLVVEYLVSWEKRGKISQDFIRFMEGKGYALIGTSSYDDYFYIKKSDKLYHKVEGNPIIEKHITD